MSWGKKKEGKVESRGGRKIFYTRPADHSKAQLGHTLEGGGRCDDKIRHLSRKSETGCSWFRFDRLPRVHESRQRLSLDPKQEHPCRPERQLAPFRRAHNPVSPGTCSCATSNDARRVGFAGSQGCEDLRGVP